MDPAVRYIAPVPIAPEDRQTTDADLARRIAAGGGDGTRDAEAELCQRYGRRLVYFGRRRLGSEDAARDLAQDALLLTLEKLRGGEVREPEKIGSFILGVARTLASTRRRRERQDGVALDDVAEELVAASLQPPDPIATARVAPCLEALPDRQRAVILLTFYAERTSGEIATSLGASVGNVRVLRHRGVAQLRDCLGLGEEVAA